MSNSIFKNLAIRCTDWNQMLQLAEMAEKDNKHPIMFRECYFNRGEVYFTVDGDFYGTTRNMQTCKTELSFDQFIQSINQK